MKKINILALLGLFSLLSFQAQAQQSRFRTSTPAFRHTLKVNPLSLAVKTFTGAYELDFNASHAVQFTYNHTGTITLGDYSYGGNGYTVEYRNYFQDKEEAEGLFLAPYLRYRNNLLKKEQQDKEDLKASVDSYGGGAVLGYRLLSGQQKHFSLDLFAGPSYFHAVFRQEELKEQFKINPAFGSFGLRAGLTVGYSF